MLFGSKKPKVAVHIANAMVVDLEFIKTKHGVPTGFWDDEYALGYMMGQINAFISAFGGDSLSIADRGRAVVESFAILSGMKGKPISEVAMVFAQEQSEDFIRAYQNAIFITTLATGNLPNEAAHPIVLSTARTLESKGEDNSRESIVAYLKRVHWVGVIRARFSI